MQVPKTLPRSSKCSHMCFVQQRMSVGIICAALVCCHSSNVHDNHSERIDNTFLPTNLPCKRVGKSFAKNRFGLKKHLSAALNLI